MVAVPTVTPQTTPALVTAAAVLLLLHTPPGVPCDKVTGIPIQTVDAPDIVPAVGAVLIVTICVSRAVPHTLVTLYIIVSRPLVTGVATPPLDIVARLLVIDHVPPDTALVNVDVEPTHSTDGPTMLPASGCGFTVIVLVVETDPQLLDTVYEMVSIPADTPVTIPEPVPTVAVVLLLLHTPPVVPLLSVIVVPTQTLLEPVMVPAVI